MIFPEAKDKSNIIKRTFNKLNFWNKTPGSDHPTFNVPPTDEMRHMCMEFYLKPIKDKLLAGQFKEDFDISDAVEHFTGLYQCCYCQYYAFSEFQVYDWKIKSIKNVIYKINIKTIIVSIIVCFCVYSLLSA